jgi:hypothetical protein
MADFPNSEKPEDTGEPAVRPGRGTPLDAAVEYVEGTLRAAREGARAFRKQIQLKSLLDPGAKSGLVGSLITGYATYFEGVSKVMSNVAQKLRSAEASKAAGER